MHCNKYYMIGISSVAVSGGAPRYGRTPLGFSGGRAAPPWAYIRTPLSIFSHPLQLLSLLRFLNSNSLTKSIIFIITGWFYVVLSFSLYSYKLWHYIYNNFDRGGDICWLARTYVYPTSDSIPKHLWICMIFGGIRKIFNPVFFHSLLDQEFDRKDFCKLACCLFCFYLAP